MRRINQVTVKTTAMAIICALTVGLTGCTVTGVAFTTIEEIVKFTKENSL